MQISFPLSVILIPYAIFIVIIAFFAFINMRNLVRFRAEDKISFIVAFIFLAGMAGIAYLSYLYLSPINWTEIIEFSFNNGF